MQRELTLAMLLLAATGAARAAEPLVTNDRYRLELVASEPEIVTPVGLAFDRDGRLLVIESHTHQPPDDYQGPADDRIRALADSDGDGRLDEWSTFAEGFRHAMNLLVRPDGGVYLVTRGKVVLLRDTNGDGRADEQQLLIQLETDDDYPHNGLGGIAQMKDGTLLLGLGENHGIAYRLVGSDGKAIVGSGGADGVFRASADGGNLERLAVGVWNPFSLCVDPHGRIFVVDNDPDASPPCRLLHIVPGGDFGYLFQYGRAGTHPLQAWNGELPGTLPLVCGTGEAPTAIVPHAGRMWVTSWGDHRVESYRLIPSGATFTAEREVVVQGDADFRPTGMAVAPDGSLYFGDWVLRDYPVHGRGRIWRLVLPAHELGDRFPITTPEQQRLTSLEAEDVEIALAADAPFVHAAGVWALAQQEKGVRTLFSPRSQSAGVVDAEKRVLTPFSDPHPRVRLGYLEALRWNGADGSLEILRRALADPSADVRLYAVRWIADERITALRDDVAALLDGPLPSPRYYLAVLAAIDWLDHEPKLRSVGITDGLLARELRNERRSPAQHALALGLLSPDHKFLTHDRLRMYLQSEHPPLRLEAVRSLAQQSRPERFAMLAEVASDADESDAVRAEAIVGLAGAAEAHRELLEQFAADENAALAREADRVLRLARLRPTPSEAMPPADNLAEWVELLNQPDSLESGDADSGRRLFFSAVGARCSVCHQHSGRGGRVGPDLTHVGRTSTRERIIASILQPSQEIAPEYQSWQLTTDDGKTHLGLRLAEGGDDGTEEYLDSEGNVFSLKSESIESRAASTTSIMPDGLEKTVSLADLRDLLAFLTASDEPQ